MKKAKSIQPLLMLLFLLMTQNANALTSVFINEIHYDNVGADTGEGVEIAGPAGTSLLDWQLLFYNGNNGDNYHAEAFGAGYVIPDLGNGFGTLVVDKNGIQNGPMDGIALINDLGVVMQFLSYEGIFVPTAGPAKGQASTDIGVSETSSTPAGYSLQLTGIGSYYEDFTWTTGSSNTFGQFNTNQSFERPPVPTPEPATLLLLGIGLFPLICYKIKRKN